MEEVAENVKKFILRTSLRVTGERAYISVPGVVRRPYTSTFVNDGLAEFYIKIYPEGKLTPHLGKLSPGDSVTIVPGPADRLPADCKAALLIGGGTGITPMLAMLRTRPDACKIWLWMWQHTPNDSFLLKEVAEMQKIAGDDLHVVLGFSRGKDGLDMEISNQFHVVEGRLDSKQVSELQFDKNVDAWVSGPSGFVNAAKSALKNKVHRVTCLD